MVCFVDVILRTKQRYDAVVFQLLPPPPLQRYPSSSSRRRCVEKRTSITTSGTSACHRVCRPSSCKHKRFLSCGQLARPSVSPPATANVRTMDASVWCRYSCCCCCHLVLLFLYAVATADASNGGTNVSRANVTSSLALLADGWLMWHCLMLACPRFLRREPKKRQKYFSSSLQPPKMLNFPIWAGASGWRVAAARWYHFRFSKGANLQSSLSLFILPFSGREPLTEHNDERTFTEGNYFHL